MIYDIIHKTSYLYSTPVSQSLHVVHLAPRDVVNQTVMQHGLFIEPAPTIRADGRDYLGNPASWLSIESRHSALVVRAQTRITVRNPDKVDLEETLAWDRVRDVLLDTNNAHDLDVMRYLAPSRLTGADGDIVEYARKSFVPGRPTLSAAWELTGRIHDDFEFDKDATDVSTPLAEVLATRRGVCQDFSHLLLACVRAMGVPARYVSGYIRTYPPGGGPAPLLGADATHAWVSVWSPESGWVDLDPTNNTILQDEHITIAYGRDYDDVSPIRGILLGGSEHTVTVNVDVKPIEN